jgi:transposase
MDPVSQQITSAILTPSGVHDTVPVPTLVKAIKDPLKTLWADGAYDGQPIRQFLHQRGIKPVIPPSRNATAPYQRQTKPFLGRRRTIYSYPELKERGQAIIHMQQFSNIEEGKKDWKKSSGYHLRSLVETTMLRFKRTFTDKLRSRRLDTQQAEVYVKCAILNKMIEMGLPYTVPIPYPAP